MTGNRRSLTELPTDVSSQPSDERIRRATESDRPFLESTYLRAGREMITAARGSWDEERELRQFREQLDIGSTWVARDGDDEVGFMMVLDGGGVTELHTLCILPEWQCRGLGTRLTLDVVDRAQRAGRVSGSWERLSSW